VEAGWLISCGGGMVVVGTGMVTHITSGICCA
jgi:hypothetical protein